jgi:arylformamidase
MIIDLSMPVNEKTVVFPGDTKPKFEPAETILEAGCLDHVIHINNHLGTHMDAPGHMIECGKWLKEYAVDRFVVDAICIDARNQAKLTAELLNGVAIEPGTAVLFYTGCGDYYAEQRYASDYPAIDPDLAQLLVNKKVSMVGVDMISYDHDAPFPIHKALLGADTLLLENLTNLEKVVGKKFTVYALPVNLELEAAPARVIAEV